MTSQRETLEKITADLIEMETMSAEHMHKVIDANRKGPKLMAIAGSMTDTPTVDSRSEDGSAEADGLPAVREAAEG